MGTHDALAARILAAIAAKGADVTFVGAADTPETYDETTDTWSGGAATGDVTGSAVQAKGDPDRLAQLGLVLARAVRLLIAAKDLSIVPAPEMPFDWAGVRYTTKTADAHGPSGDPMYYDVIGAA